MDSKNQGYLNLAKEVAPEKLDSFLSENAQSPDSPIVLVCQSGILCQKTAHQVVHNYINTFYLEGGADSL